MNLKNKIIKCPVKHIKAFLDYVECDELRFLVDDAVKLNYIYFMWCESVPSIRHSLLKTIGYWSYTATEFYFENNNPEIESIIFNLREDKLKRILDE